MVHQNYLKQKIALKYFLIGSRFHKAVKLLEFAKKYHSGIRKDGKTPEFMHQVEIANFIRTLPLPEILLEKCIMVALIHDLYEDYKIDIDKFQNEFGISLTEKMKLLSKVHDGIKLSNDIYYKKISSDMICCIVKGVDRMHNISSMHSAFTIEKQLSYIDETEKFVLPMLKVARNEYTGFENVFENIKHSILIQIETIKAIHNG